MRAILVAPLLLASATAAATVTPRGLYTVAGAPAVLPPTELATFAAG